MTRFVGQTLKLSAAIILIAPITLSAVAQQSVKVETAELDPCYNESKRPGFKAEQRAQGTIDVFDTKTDRELKKYEYSASAQLSQNRDQGFANTKARTNRNGPGEPEFVGAQGAQPDPANEGQELAKKLSNPVASLISLPLQSNFDFGMGTGSGWRYTLNIQPVLPIKLNAKWNLISRTILPIIHQGNVTGPNTSQSGLGDIVQSLFFSPNKTEPFIWAVGPVVLIPTGTDKALGSQKWGLGPTALALKQKDGWTYGVLVNHIWSVAGKSNRSDVNATFIQPFLSYSTKDAWTYSINTESTYDWTSNSWAVPIHPFISKLVRFGKQPISFGGGLRCWVTTPNGGPEGCGLRIVVTALFPKK